MKRFWDKVNKNGPKVITTPCWVWVASTNMDGYGRFKLSNPRRDVPAHRFSWEMRFGEVPIGHLVCHKCDNPTCVNPDHLFVGKPIDNVRDMIRKGRKKNPDTKLTVRNGEDNGCAKVTWEVVRKIRSRYKTGDHTQQALANCYGINQRSISNIVTGKTWKE